MQDLTHLSLFTGIGGLDLAAEWAGFRTIGQCEWADYPRGVLEKHWPDVPRWRDIHDLTADDFFRRTGCAPGGCTCISGGFPCQPHSVAGKRKASGDERDLWHEFRRVVSEVRPTWVVAENVRGLLSSEHGKFFLGVLRDFADLGYDVCWGVTSAAAVGAPHRRERVAIVAHAGGQRLQGLQLSEAYSGGSEPWRAWTYGPTSQCGYDGRSKTSTCWEFEPCVGRVAHGVPHRVDRIKCLGNAVVPQQFYPIFRVIAESERN